MRIMAEVIARETPELHRQGVQIRHLGSTVGVPPELVKAIADALHLTQHNKRLILSVAFNYGGRAEIVTAVQHIVAEGISPAAITDETISHHLYTAGMPDPDMIIRTAGDQRLSNFLIWQAAYAEYWFTPLYWPDFDGAVLYEALADFSRRTRKFGMTAEQVSS
jgi:undecaprenyl diphosphate synthase